MASLASIRAQVEQRLSGRVAAPFASRPSDNQPVLPSGIPSIDLAGGVPCGAITEIVGTRWCSVGRKTVQTQLLSRATQARLCALIDATDSFDPKSAGAAGVYLKHLLWVRCRGRELRVVEQAFKSADLILQGGGGFGLVLLDLAAVSDRSIQKIPMSTWFRFRAVVEKLSTALVVLTPYSVAGTCSSLKVNLSGASVRWSQLTEGGPSYARLSEGLDFAVQITNRRSPKKPSQSVRTFSADRQWAQS